MKLFDIAFKIIIIILLTYFLYLYDKSTKYNDNIFSGFYTPGVGDGVSVIDKTTGTVYIWEGFRGRDINGWIKISPFGSTTHITIPRPKE